MTGLTWTKLSLVAAGVALLGLWVSQAPTATQLADIGSIVGITVVVGAVLFVAAGATFVWVFRRR